MLLHFIQFFSCSKTGSERDLREDLIKWSLGEMKNGLKTLSGAVQDLPRTAPADMASPTKAALAFAIPREVFPTSNDEQWKLLTQLLDRSQKLRSELDGLPDVEPTLKLLLDTWVLSDDDDKRLTIAAQTTDSTDSPVV